MIRNVWKQVQGQVIHGAQLNALVQELKYGLKTMKSAVTSQRAESSRCFPILCLKRGDLGGLGIRIGVQKFGCYPFFSP